MKMLRFSDVAASGYVRGKRVFIRADLNVPLTVDGRVAEDTRIRASLPCIRMALDAGAAVMVTSHLGRPCEGTLVHSESLAPVAQRMGEMLRRSVPLVANWTDGVEVRPGELVLLENCRANVGEKANSEDLGRRMASLCDVFVHDAFGTAHRAEASTHRIALHAPIACAGPLLSAELDAIGAALANPRRPLVAIVGGSKVSTKLTILRALAEKVDHLIVGGGIANTFMLAAGLDIGKSLVERDLVGEARAVMDLMAARGALAPIPVDVVVASEWGPEARARIRLAAEIEPGEMILDIGPETARGLAEQVERAGTIVWNGPLGVFELEAFEHGTRKIAEAIARSEAYSIAGGGDTLAAIAKFGVRNGVDYISTGGGAFLELLEGKTLLAVAALQQRASL